MREFSFNLDKDILNKGLRADDRESINAFAIRTMKNLKPSPFGLVPPSTITNPVNTPSTSTVVWPLPKILRGENSTTLIKDNSGTQEFYAMTETAGAWTGSILAPKKAESTGTTYVPSSGKHWEKVSFDTNWILCNGEDLIYNFPGNASDLVLGVKTDGSTGLKCKSIAKHTKQNRLFLGGLSGTYFTGSAQWTSAMFPIWASAISHPRPQGRPEQYTSDSQTFGDNYVMWSDFAGGDYEVPFVTLLAMLGLPDSTTYDEINDAAQQDLEDGKTGMVQLKCQGAVLAIKQLGDNLVCYTEDKVIMLVPDEQYYTQQEILSVGIKSRTAVGGNEAEHIFVDVADNLWKISSNGIERLRYNELMDNLTAADIVISMDPLERDYWITDGSTGYILTPEGLCETTRLPTSLNRISDGLVGISTVPSTGNTEKEFTLKFDLGDLGARDFKTLKQMDVFSLDLVTLKGKWLYKYKANDKWSGTPLSPANFEGVIFCGKPTAIDFQGQLEGAWNNVRSKLERVTIRYQGTGKRNRRGAQGVIGRQQDSLAQ